MTHRHAAFDSGFSPLRKPFSAGAAFPPLDKCRSSGLVKVLRSGSDISLMLIGFAQPVPGDTP